MHPPHPTLAAKAYALLRAKLARGKLRPGDRLVNRALAEEIGMSFTPVREAINQLASEGLVEYRRGAGAFVRTADADEVRELYDLREILESFAAASAAEHATLEEVAGLRAASERGHALDRALRARRDSTRVPARQRDEWIATEEAFHGALLAAAHNRWVTKVATELRLIARVFAHHRALDALVTAETVSASWQDHARLVELIASGDRRQARRCMAAHVRRGREHVSSLLETTD